MDLMNNKYLLFEGIEFNGSTVRNITEFNILPEIPAKYLSETYILEFKVDNDRLIEGICFELYETTHYWDILLAINKINKMNQLPVNYDIVLLRAQESLSKWMDTGKFMISSSLDSQYDEVMGELNGGFTISLNPEYANTDKEIVKKKYLEILEEENNRNEKYRNLKYISLSDMGELEAVLLANKQLPKLNPALIINKSEIQ